MRGWIHKRGALTIGLALAAVFLWRVASHAQLVTGTISGTVADASGAMIPGAAVTAKNTATGVTRSTTTGSIGRYEFPNLPPGSYEISGAMQGFQTSVRSGIELTVGRNAVVDVVLQVGEVTQVVNVTGEASLVETTTATVSSLVDEKKVEDLPLNNRDLTQLVFLQPGVLKIPQEQFGYRSGMGDTVSVSGARGSQNMYLLDGVSNSDLSGNAQGASSAYIGAETVKEFQIITNNYSAEYESLPGAIISAVTKSGTNQFHGSVFEFIRNDNLDAAKWETGTRGGGVKPEFKRNQFGGSLGGPIIKDKTFFFGSYEGLRERKGETDQVNVPNADARRGILFDGPVTIDPRIRPYLNFYPVPGVDFPEVPGTRELGARQNIVQLAGMRRIPTNDDFVAAKLDHHFGGAKAGFITGTYNIDDSEQSPFDMMGVFTSRRGNASRKHVVSLGHTSVLSAAAVNVFNFGFTLARVVGEIPQDDGFDWKTACNGGDCRFITTVPDVVTRMGRIRPSGVQDLGFPNSEASYQQKNMSAKDGLSLTLGNHSLRMGFQLDRFRYDIDACSSLCYGEYRFADVKSFLMGTVQRFETIFHEASAPFHRDVKQLMFGSYLQDNFRVTDSLTLNLGLRHEFVTVPKEINDISAGLIHFMDAQTTVGPYYTNATLKSFSPRIGFAYAPGSKKTSFRGGVGIFYDQPLLYEFRTVTTDVPPFTVTRRLDSGFNFPNDYAQATAVTRLSDTGMRGAQYDQVPTKIFRWSFGVQRDLGAGWVGSAGYTGARAQHLWLQFVPNLNRWVNCPQRTPCGDSSGPAAVSRWPGNPVEGQYKYFPATSLGRINPAFQEMRWQAPVGNSFHHGLEMSLQKRLSRGLQVQMSYTFAKTIDQGADVTSGELAEGQRQMYFWDMQLMRGLSNQDIRSTFSSNFSYEVPAPNMGAVGNALLKGWQTNGILTLASGHPITINDIRTVQENRMGYITGLRPDLVPDGDNNPHEGVVGSCGYDKIAGHKLGTADNYFDPCQFSLPTPGFFGNLGRSSLVTPGLATFDFSFFKDIHFTEQNKLQFRVETFNLFNKVNLGTPNANPWDANGVPNPIVGRIDRTRTSARQIQFGLKFLF